MDHFFLQLGSFFILQLGSFFFDFGPAFGKKSWRFGV